MKQPILTRRWTVGAGASCIFDCHLVIPFACQTVINLCDSTSAPNGIASDLFSMMINPENFIDVTLIRCFNKAHVNKHFDWMQTCKDLTQELGFQAHNIAIRFYLMDKDIRGVMWGRSMEEHHEAVNKAVANENGGVVDVQQERNRHIEKLNIFMDAAHNSLHKHFPRWSSHKLMPAALLSEGPLAKIVAAAMLNRNTMPIFAAEEGVDDLTRTTGRIECCATVHKEKINLIGFDNFIRLQLEKTDDGVEAYSPQAVAAAERILCGVDFRMIDHSDDNGELRWAMQATYLPVASMLQFVESGVKEAKCVSATDRSEAVRSCMAIIRSGTPLGKDKSIEPDRSFVINKILAIIQSAIDRSEPHIDWIKGQAGNEYWQRYNQVHYLMKQGHFRDDRIESKRAGVDERGATFKRPNVHQQLKAQTLTSTVTGLTPCGKLKKARNMLDLEEELLFRHIPVEEISPLFTERKDMLKCCEIERLVEEGIREEDAANLKTFKKQSNAPFKLTDD